ncbi:MAG TPA: histidine kinase dimerization/phospho-acceptor domain-containing protein, partial [Hyphomonadaceae bacterium]|nr:histidine kinase dimerization/phospho-acceptor domain-containing protein [Hyphomonadaceae bacterium]
MGARAGWQWGTGAVLLLTVATLVAIQSGKTTIASVFAGALGVTATAFFLIIVVQQRETSRAAEALQQVALEKALADLAAMRAMVHAAFESYPAAMALMWDGKIEFSNAAAAATGLLPGNAAGDMPAWFKSVTAGAANDGSGKPESIRMMLNGQEHYFSPHTTVVRDGAGTTRGLLIMLTHVTQTNAAGETGAKFVSSFSHELRTPLTSIQMTIHLLLEDTSRMSPRQVEFLQAARDDANRLQTLIEEMVAAVRARL